MLSRLNTSALLLRHIDEITVFHECSWGYLCWVSNYKVVDVVVVDDIGDSAGSLLHLLLPKATLILDISDGRFFLLVLFTL